MSVSQLYKHTGRTEIITVIDDPVVDIEDPNPPTQTNSMVPNPNPDWGSTQVPRPPGTSIPNPNSTEQTINIISLSNTIIISCVIGEKSGFSLWQTDDQGNLVRQISPCIPR